MMTLRTAPICAYIREECLSGYSPPPKIKRSKTTRAKRRTGADMIALAALLRLIEGCGGKE